MDQTPPSKPETQIVQHVNQPQSDSIGLVNKRVESFEQNISSNAHLPAKIVNLEKDVLELKEKYVGFLSIIDKKADALKVSLNYEISNERLEVQKKIEKISKLNLELTENISNTQKNITLIYKELSTNDQNNKSAINTNLYEVTNLLKKHQQSYQKKLTILYFLNFLGFGTSFALLYYLWQHMHK